jgi:hypothetical protein
MKLRIQVFSGPVDISLYSGNMQKIITTIKNQKLLWKFELKKEVKRRES